MQKIIWLFLLFIVIVFAGCKEEGPITNNDQHEEEKPPEHETGTPVLRFLSFRFNKSLNPELTEDVRGTIAEDKITVLLPETALDLDLNLIPSFIGEYKSVELPVKSRVPVFQHMISIR